MPRRFYPHEIGDMIDNAHRLYVDMLLPHMTLRAAEVSAGGFFGEMAIDKEDIAWIKHSASRAVTFDFLTVSPKQEDVEHANNVMQTGQMRLPFRVCVCVGFYTPEKPIQAARTTGLISSKTLTPLSKVR